MFLMNQKCASCRYLFDKSRHVFKEPLKVNMYTDYDSVIQTGEINLYFISDEASIPHPSV